MIDCPSGHDDYVPVQMGHHGTKIIMTKEVAQKVSWLPKYQAKCFKRFSHPVGVLALLFLLVLEPKVRIRLAKREGVVAKGGGSGQSYTCSNSKEASREREGADGHASDQLQRAVVNFINEINEPAEGYRKKCGQRLILL